METKSLNTTQKCFQSIIDEIIQLVLICLTVYDTSGAASDRNCVVLNDIHIDIMDYIVPASCTDTEFRQMWAEFEWENKVAINTNITSLPEYLEHLVKSTNMKCLTPEKVGADMVSGISFTVRS